MFQVHKRKRTIVVDRNPFDGPQAIRHIQKRNPMINVI
uniref:Uncharacterized protein n=1 Tax=Rhizophora mucronata TaxID=61149 RepID=A0A2P2J183_RHIMU